jgi:hypothetical protein
VAIGLAQPVLAMRPRTLAAFMSISAASALRRKVLMWTCLHCGHWFEVHRKDALFCTAACRATNGNRKYRQPHHHIIDGGQTVLPLLF